MADQTCNPSIITQALGIQATGPRTVIVPADPIIWDAETSYEYLTLVASTDFGQAYISKRDVPAGTALTDTDYWIQAASYNAQLAAIQGQLNELTSDLATQIEDVEASVKDTVFQVSSAPIIFNPYCDWYDESLDPAMTAQGITNANGQLVIGGSANDSSQAVWFVNSQTDSVSTVKFNDANNHASGLGYRNGTFYMVSNEGTVQERNSSMTLLATHNLTEPILAVDTFGETGFVGRDFNHVYIYDSSFTLQSSFEFDNNPDNVCQAITTNGDFIYCLNTYNIQIFDSEGTPLGVMLENNSFELEDATFIGDNMYVLVNPGNKGFIVLNITLASTNIGPGKLGSSIEMVQNGKTLCQSPDYLYTVHNGVTANFLYALYPITSIHINSNVSGFSVPSLSVTSRIKMSLITDQTNVEVGVNGGITGTDLVINPGVQLYPEASGIYVGNNVIHAGAKAGYPSFICKEFGFNFGSGLIVITTAQQLFSGTLHTFNSPVFLGGTADRANAGYNLITSPANSGHFTMTDFGQCAIAAGSNISNNVLVAEVSTQASGGNVVQLELTASNAHKLTFTGSGCDTSGNPIYAAVNVDNSQWNFLACKINGVNGYITNLYVR